VRRTRARRATALILLVGALVGLLVGATSPLAAQPDQPAALAPLSARFPARGTTVDTAITQLSVEQADAGSDPIVVVGFSQGFPLPGDGYRLAVQVGDPAAERVRASLLVEGGAPTGVLEQGDGTSWESLGNTRVAFDPAGSARIELPADLVADRTSIWVEVEVGGAVAASTPVFSWADLRGETDPGVLGVSDYGVVTDGQLVPTGDLVELVDGPVLEYANGSILITFPGPPPADVRGNPALAVIDYLRFGAEPANGGLPPFYVTIDHTSRQIVLWDGSTGLPVPVEVDPATWLVQGFPPPDPAAPAPAVTSEIVVSLDGLSQAIGLPVDDPAFGMGVARSISLADARIVTFDGVLGLTAWFEGSAAATLPPIEDDIAELAPPTTVAPVDDAAGGSGPWLVIGLVGAGLVVGGAVVWFLRRRADDTDDFTAIGTAPSAPTPTDDAGPPVGTGSDAVDLRATPRAAGVSPDEALAALQRTVEEVTAKLDGPATDRPRVKVPGGPDEQPAVRRGAPKPPDRSSSGAAGPPGRGPEGSPTDPPSSPPPEPTDPA
jgi:hypothetical protein